MATSSQLSSILPRLGLLVVWAFSWLAAGDGDPRRDYFLTSVGGAIPATDSAAAATAIATGYKTEAGNIAWLTGDPAGGALPTIAEQLRAERGFAIGIASTVPFSHATPAGFASHNTTRDSYEKIANEIITSTRPEVVIGAGHPSYLGSYSYVGGQATWQALLSGGTAYTKVVTRAAGVNGNQALLAAAGATKLSAGDRLIGVFGGSGISLGNPSPADSPGAPSVTPDNPENPTLAGIVSAGLAVLSQDSQGFFVMFEQGGIDGANHDNHFKNMIGGVWDLDQAVRTAEAYIDRPGGPEWSNTLMIVTADHANGYLRLQKALGPGDLPRQGSSTGSYPDGELSYATTGHTNEPVTLQARGKGAGLFAGYAGAWYPDTSIVDNTQIYVVMRRAVAEQGVRHLILFIGDGMPLASEVAASRYLYGSDSSLAWQDWGRLSGGWSGYAATWDVTTYNRFADRQDQPDYAPPAGSATPGANQAWLGYDPAKGGAAPEFVRQPWSIFLSVIRR